MIAFHHYNKDVVMRLLFLILLMGCVHPNVVNATETLTNKIVDESQRIDINTADASTLAEWLPGIGPAKAALIVEWRKQHGPFTQIDQLQQIKGIGPKTLSKLRDHVRIGPGLTSNKYWQEEEPFAERQAQMAVQRVFRTVRQASDPAAMSNLPLKPWYRKSVLEILSLR